MEVLYELKILSFSVKFVLIGCTLPWPLAVRPLPLLFAALARLAPSLFLFLSFSPCLASPYLSYFLSIHTLCFSLSPPFSLPLPSLFLSLTW